jgi:hypothetical protein
VLQRIRSFGRRCLSIAVPLPVVVLFALGVILWVIPVSPVTIEWETGSEVGTAGFNLYRALTASSDAELTWTLVNSDLIPARGDEILGADYRYEDHDVQAGRRYHYRIEEVEWGGKVTTYPHVIDVRAGVPRSWIHAQGVVLIALSVVLLWRRNARVDHQ